ncbi:MAG: MFS transporter [Sphingobacteriales bacterium]|nr:MFS transporter [Sphingobacteriales bacterium]MBI3719141.1 MFS transporter [Sphingobacteriales bacterium]
MNKQHQSVLNLVVIVAALGYFVDIYDLLLFGIIRIKSLTSLGLDATQVRDSGELIISIQMAGLLIGGIIWGIMGDKKGRLSVLFGSIILYSIANIANGFVQTVNQYALVRFIAGIGLAGELGAGITLVSESLPKEKRGLGTSLVSGIGILGAVVAFFISKYFDWRVCYFIGGGLGFLLLLLRVSVFESGMFEEVKEKKVSRGNFFMFFNNAHRFKRYLICIFIGLPTWYVIGLLITFSKEFARPENLNVSGTVDPGAAIMYCYIATSAGGILIGLISQWLKSRKKALYIFYAIIAIFMVLFFTQTNGTATQMYINCAGLGFGCGIWAIFITMGAEQFGTNLRATAATTIPNMVRGSLPLILILFKTLREPFNYVTAAWITGIIIMVITVVAAILSEETFHKDLNYLEGDVILT